MAVAEGNIPHDDVDAGAPVAIGGIAQANISSHGDVAGLDRVRAVFTLKGVQYVTNTANNNGAAADAQSNSSVIHYLVEGDEERVSTSVVFPSGLAPDGAWDRLRIANDAAPGLGALNVALIGGDQALRASGTAGEASGTSTALDNMGWVKSFLAHLDVTAVPTGGSPTLDVHIETQLPSGDWIQIVAFTQNTAVSNEVVSWGPVRGGIETGTLADAETVVVSVTFAENAALDTGDIRLMVLGDSLRVQWVFAAGGSTGDFTFAVTSTFHS